MRFGLVRSGLGFVRIRLCLEGIGLGLVCLRLGLVRVR